MLGSFVQAFLGAYCDLVEEFLELVG